MTLQETLLRWIPPACVGLVYGGTSGLILTVVIMPLGALLRRRPRWRGG